MKLYLSGKTQFVQKCSSLQEKPLYVRSIDKLLREIRNAAIRKEYDDGGLVKVLAKKYQLSTRSVETILSSSSKRTESNPKHKQTRKLVPYF